MTKILIPSLVPQVAKIKIKHPLTGETEFELADGTNVELEIHVVGRNSKQWLDFMKELKVKGGDDRDELFSRISDSARQFVSRLIVGWTDNGALNESYSVEAAEELLMDPSNTWIMEQLQEAILTESNFFLTSLGK